MRTHKGLDMDVILVEILAKTLIRFKSVCKSLNFVISSRDFVRLYLRHQSLSSSATDKCLILAGDHRINCYQFDQHATTTPTTFVYSKTSRHEELAVIGTSNGLLCIRLIKGNFSEFSILNPTTRSYRCIRTLHEELGVGHSYGFGFDHENLDYIIVVVSDYLNNSAVKTRITSVYSLNKNSWRVVNEIAVATTDTTEGVRMYGVLIDNNLLHWMFWIPELRKHRIGCFDICKNKWTDDVLLPRFYYDLTWQKKIRIVDFGVIDDCLSLTFMDRIEKRDDVWVMKEYGVQESWVRMLSIPDFNCFQIRGGINLVACCQSSDTVLVRLRYSSRLFWYNKVDGGHSEAKFDVAPNFWDNIHAYMCSRSLVHLPGGQLFEHFDAVYKSSTDSL
ncbi:F-box protein CPR1-like [Silene latifolia]|uniref:F-box protein CPR1-like n=1 Tax=Silene latifolia TaxID=37657 RepID=UPI003D7763DF